MKSEIKEELESLSPHLSKLDKYENYEIPFMYFDNLANSVISKANIEQKRPEISVLGTLMNLFFKSKMVIGLGVMLLMIGAFWMINAVDNTSSFQALANNVSPEDMNTYIIEHIDDFTIEHIQDLDIELSISFDELAPIDDELLDEIIDDFDDTDLEGI